MEIQGKGKYLHQLEKILKDSDMKNKVMNDTMAFVRTMAKERGRNEDAFKEMIENAKSFDAQEAFSLKIIDGLASNQVEYYHSFH